MYVQYTWTQRVRICHLVSRATQPLFRWLYRYSSNLPLLILNFKFKASTAADCKSISLCTPYSVIRRTREPNYPSILNIEIAHHSLSWGTPILIDGASKICKMGSRIVLLQKESGTQQEEEGYVSCAAPVKIT